MRFGAQSNLVGSVKFSYAINHRGKSTLAYSTITCTHLSKHVQTQPAFNVKRPRTIGNFAIKARVFSMPSSESSYTALKSPSHYPSSPRLSRHSNDTDDSLRHLELSEAPTLVDPPRHLRGRSYSISGFDFQHDLLPLSASLSEPDTTKAESSEKHIGLFNGESPKETPIDM